MRLRVCMMLAALGGATGALILAADLYRRVSAAERIAIESASGSAGGTLIFGMAHVLGSAAMAILFLAICLLLVADRKNTAAEKEAAETAALSNSNEVAAEPAKVEVPQPAVEKLERVEERPATEGQPPISSSSLPKPRPGPPAPKAAFRPAKNIYFVEAPPTPAHTAPAIPQREPIGVPMPLTESELTRAVVYENVLREQGEVPVGTPVESDSKETQAVRGENAGDNAAKKRGETR